MTNCTKCSTSSSCLACLSGSFLKKGKDGCIADCSDEATSYLNDKGTECTASCTDKISSTNQCVKECEDDEYATAGS